VSTPGEIPRFRPIRYLRDPLWRDPLAWLTLAVAALAFVGNPGRLPSAIAQCFVAVWFVGPVVGRARAESGGRGWLPTVLSAGLACALVGALTTARGPLFDAGLFALGAFFAGGLFFGPLVSWALAPRGR
jgi:hypothetical protein